MNVQTTKTSSDTLDIDPQYLQMTNAELLELVHNHDKFTHVVNKFIEVAENKISTNQTKNGIQILIEAQRILQYAASCGKNIDRGLIMAVLHNQAFGYQRMWELNKCSNYLEALIFNINAKVSSIETPAVHSENNLDSNANTIDTRLRSETLNGCKLLRRLDPDEKLKLAKYHLQFAAINSQLKNHQKASQASMKAVNIIKQLFADRRISSKAIDNQINEPTLIKLILDSITKLDDQPNISGAVSYPKICKTLHHNWLQNIKKQHKLPDVLNNFTIGLIMQIRPYNREIKDLESTKYTNPNYIIESGELQKYEISYSKVLQQILLLCVAYFTLATQMRLGAQCRIQSLSAQDVGKQEWNNQYKQAEIYHILSLMLYFAYVPGRFDFMSHLLSSFTNNYDSEILYSPNDEDIELNTEQTMFVEKLIIYKNVGEYFLTESGKFIRNITLTESIKAQKGLVSVRSQGYLGENKLSNKDINIRKLQKKCQRLINNKYDEERDSTRKRNKTQFRRILAKSKSLIHHRLTTSNSKIMHKKKKDGQRLKTSRQTKTARKEQKHCDGNSARYYDLLLHQRKSGPFQKNIQQKQRSHSIKNNNSSGFKKNKIINELQKTKEVLNSKKIILVKSQKKIMLTNRDVKSPTAHKPKQEARPVSRKKMIHFNSPDLNKKLKKKESLCKRTKRPQTGKKEIGSDKKRAQVRNDYGI